jgi:heme A synthase
METRFVPLTAALAALVSTASAAPIYQTFVFIDGVPTEVSAGASHGNGHVYLNGVYIGTLNSFGQIISPQGQMVGFVVLLTEGGRSK